MISNKTEDLITPEITMQTISGINPAAMPSYMTLGMTAMTLESFSGKQDVKDYFEKLDSRAELDGWTDEVKLKLVKYRLSGEAYTFYKADPAVFNEKNYTEFKNKFLEKFTPSRIPGQALIKLSKCYQRHDESISNYVIRLKSLGAQILADDLKKAPKENIPGLKQKNLELVLNQFRLGIKKEMLKNLTPLLMRTDNLTIEKAENFAKQFELSDMMVSTRYQNNSNTVFAIHTPQCYFCGRNNHYTKDCRIRNQTHQNKNYQNTSNFNNQSRPNYNTQRSARFENNTTRDNYQLKNNPNGHFNQFNNNKQFYDNGYNNYQSRQYNFPNQSNTKFRSTYQSKPPENFKSNAGYYNQTKNYESRNYRATNTMNDGQSKNRWGQNNAPRQDSNQNGPPNLNVNQVEALNMDGLSLQPRRKSLL